MLQNYECAVCGGEYSKNEVMGTTCDTCGKLICIYCTEYDRKTDTDYCDKCADEMMFNHVEAHGDAPLHKLKRNDKR